MRADKFKAIEQFLQREFNVNDTLKLLRFNYPIYASWGAKNPTNLFDKALMITVNGHHHKGKVLISLAWDDTYIVTFLNGQNNIKESHSNIYCDELVRFIDDKVEYISDYEDN